MERKKKNGRSSLPSPPPPNTLFSRLTRVVFAAAVRSPNTLCEALHRRKFRKMTRSVFKDCPTTHRPLISFSLLFICYSPFTLFHFSCIIHPLIATKEHTSQSPIPTPSTGFTSPFSPPGRLFSRKK
eukprot:Hpha_TRINITY_DN16633_c0_g6::TRINITY_DN16633_c0_g6_i2::g.179503::m.179503